MEGKILVVEDEPDILDVVRYNLVQTGFEVVAAEDGEAALELRELASTLNEMRRQIQDRINQITAEKSRLEGVLASITEGILVTEADGRVRMTNVVAFCESGLGVTKGDYRHDRR